MNMNNQSRRVKLVAVPEGLPKESDFLVEDVAVPECPLDGLLVKTRYLSVDPYLRGRIAGKKTYVDPIPVGNVMESGCVGEVVASRNGEFKVGEMVAGMWGWQDYVGVDVRRVQRIDAAEAPVSTALGILGMPGMTAYFGFTELCLPKAGETVVVSGAAGAVGSAVGQIAKILGCHVVGVAGTEEKVAFVKSLGFDGAVNYRTDKPYGAALAALCPKGIDCYFDNVGGEMTDAVLGLMNTRGRVAVCGQIASYNDRSADLGQRPYTDILVKQLRVEGFIVSRWGDRFPEGRKQMAAWLKAGLLRYEETLYKGLESAPRAFIGLFAGENTGKALVEL
jgi:NADPH-dependent curcumin reductase CurA